MFVSGFIGIIAFNIFMIYDKKSKKRG